MLVKAKSGDERAVEKLYFKFSNLIKSLSKTIHYGPGIDYPGHYVTAYRYINNGTQYNDFYVLDTANWDDKDDPMGVFHTVPAAQTHNAVGAVDFLVLTNAK